MTTVAVAWGLAAWLPQRSWDENTSVASASSSQYLFTSEFWSIGAVRRTWMIDNPGAFSRYPPSMAIPNSNIKMADPGQPPNGPHWGRIDAVRSNPMTSPGSGMEHATGWPVLAGWYSVSSAFQANTYRCSIDGGIGLNTTVPGPFSSDEGSMLRALPLRPIYPGLAINTTFYAALWLILLTTLRAVRRTRRRRHNRCPACAYDLSGLTPNPQLRCPECGHAATTPVVVGAAQR
jgi:hypothetical protein